MLYGHPFELYGSETDVGDPLYEGMERGQKFSKTIIWGYGRCCVFVPQSDAKHDGIKS